jgi:hypothetical protein
MKAVERRDVDKQDVRHMTDAELSDMGVSIINRTDLVLKCNDCGETWAPQLDSRGRLAQDYWLCPLKCNSES